MKKFRLLGADEIESRVSTCTEKAVTILLYKTARVDADLLDETVGPDKWQNDFKLVDGVLYGGIGVDYGDGFVWKWDAGIESNTEAEKGRASDAFKRAGFKHGIGRELYSAPRIRVYAEFCNIKENGTDRNGKKKYACYDDFDVMEIGYDENERINRLVIGIKGKPVFELGKQKAAPAAKKTTQSCEECGSTILPVMGKDGNTIEADEVIATSLKRYGRKLCASCCRKMSQANGNS